MAWCRPSDKPLSEPTIAGVLMHICITWPQWVNSTQSQAVNVTALICYQQVVGISMQEICMVWFYVRHKTNHPAALVTVEHYLMADISSDSTMKYSRTYFTMGWWADIPNFFKFLLLYSPFMIMESGHDFAHATTAQLSWHVQNYALICVLLFMQEHCIYLRDVDVELMTSRWNWYAP